MVNDLQDGTALSCIIVEGSLADYGFIMLLTSRLVAALALAGTAIASLQIVSSQSPDVGYIANMTGLDSRRDMDCEWY